ncbi:hypothetical protein BM451_00085, partial [Dickeya dadantii]
FFTSQTNIFETRFFTNDYRIIFFWRITVCELNTFKMLFLIITIHIRKAAICTIHMKAIPMKDIIYSLVKITIIIHTIKICLNYPMRIIVIIWLSK